MYFPYLRGKQFELIAIRELIEKKLIAKDRIIPVIEPVRLSSTLRITIEVAEEKNYPFVLVFNPKVGTLKNKTKKIADEYLSYVYDNLLYHGYLTNENMVNEISELRDNKGVKNDQFSIVHNDNLFANEYNEIFPPDNNPPAFNLVPDQRTYGRKIKENKVIFVDHLTPQDRNADYLDPQDEFFSEDHLYYEEEGFIGFSDFVTIGSAYQDSGFAPYAVVIHITYLASDETFRIKHFVSDTNDDYSDTPRKFYEALTKLINWKNNEGIDTYALQVLQAHFDEQSYPGLGSLKKLSIMHHLELVDKYLRG